MNYQHQAIKLFEEKDYLFFLLQPDLTPDIISALKSLEQDGTVVCTWSFNQDYPLEGQLTTKGQLFRDYLKNNEW
ncbi:hypothetical protein FEM33_05085 [Dyadobacter flavalbus]|uniref:Uncharacterized protein n=1 Tax=Dyadobacter flavalbus TaxID=2579942 RepID=A0A5M8QZR4_9BACT|nr:hypothetical protein [Dyadobacter flavalbus]KAA6440901.1 hypothetical protein FEM33_05085 [Dyadobacter flavalbus]